MKRETRAGRRAWWPASDWGPALVGQRMRPSRVPIFRLIGVDVREPYANQGIVP